MLLSQEKKCVPDVILNMLHYSFTDDFSQEILEYESLCVIDCHQKANLLHESRFALYQILSELCNLINHTIQPMIAG